MAGIDIKNSWWSDPRRTRLMFLLKSELLTDGLAVAVWRVSQEFWSNHNHGIPRSRFFLIDNAQAFIDVGLADDQGDFIYVKGSFEHHDWIRKKKEAGRKGALKTNEILHGRTRQTTANDGPSPIPIPIPKSRSISKKQNTIAQQVERVYQDLYPRKIGKTKGVKKLARDITSEADLENFEKAVKNYASHVAGKSNEYVKHFSTFSSEWRDWITVSESDGINWQEVFGENYVPESQ